MAELTFKSPGVSSREIDLSGPTTLRPQGTPAGVIGTAQKGRAFVPITFATYQDFVAEFGATDGKKFGPLAMNEWMRNARAGTYVRVLGVGDAKQRQSGGNNSGRVTNAGFVVGDQQVWDNGLVGYNRYALRGAALAHPGATPGALGRTFLLGSFMTQKASSTVLSDAGLDIGTAASFPILRGVLMSASGVHLSLKTDNANNNTPSQTRAAQFKFGEGADAGASVGTTTVANGKQSFVMLLNGHVPTGQYSNVVTASLDPTAADHFKNVFNTDPEKMQEAGHLLYAHYDIHPSIAVPSATGRASGGNTNESVFLVTGSQGRNSGNASVPNYENFEDRFQTAHTPWFISQKFGGRNKELFRIHALDDGARANDLFKITIENIAASNNNNQKFGKFDLLVRDFYDTDQDQVVFEAFRGPSLDPSSDRYIARVIGDLNIYYDFDQPKGRQKLRVEGSHPNVSRYIRVEVATQVERGSIADEAIPVGFQGPHHLLTSGTTDGGSVLVGGVISGSVGLASTDLACLKERPLPMRNNLVQGVGLKNTIFPCR